MYFLIKSWIQICLIDWWGAGAQFQTGGSGSRLDTGSILKKKGNVWR